MARNTQTRLDAFLPKTDTSPRQPSRSWRDAMPEASDTPLEKHPLRVYVLCGVVGSGKSTLAIQWEALYPKNYVRVNQDSLGDRRQCESLTRESLQEGKSPIIDRQNFDPSQRYHWLNIGYEHGVEVVALVFRTTRRVCSDRLLLRTGHETIKSPEQGLQILASMIAIFTEPSTEEGFHKIVNIPNGMPLHYTLADINALLAKVDEAPALPAKLPPQPAPGPPRRGMWNRGTLRGRGASRGAGSRHAQTGDRATLWSRNSSLHASRPPATINQVICASPQVMPNTGAGQARNRPSPPACETRKTIGQPHQPYVALNKEYASVASVSTRSAKKAPSTGFIDISSDEGT